MKKKLPLRHQPVSISKKTRKWLIKISKKKYKYE